MDSLLRSSDRRSHVDPAAAAPAAAAAAEVTRLLYLYERVTSDDFIDDFIIDGPWETQHFLTQTPKRRFPEV